MKCKCDYEICNRDAVTTGFVLARPDKPDGKHEMVKVNACEKHRKVNSFFDNEIADGK